MVSFSTLDERVGEDIRCLRNVSANVRKGLTHSRGRSDKVARSRHPCAELWLEHSREICPIKWIELFREARNCFLSIIWSTGFLFWYKKTVIPKKKVINARNLKDCLPNLLLKTRKAKKRKSKFFHPDNFVIPWVITYRNLSTILLFFGSVTTLGKSEHLNELMCMMWRRHESWKWQRLETTLIFLAQYLTYSPVLEDNSILGSRRWS